MRSFQPVIGSVEIQIKVDSLGPCCTKHLLSLKRDWRLTISIVYSIDVFYSFHHFRNLKLHGVFKTSILKFSIQFSSSSSKGISILSAVAAVGKIFDVNRRFSQELTSCIAARAESKKMASE